MKTIKKILVGLDFSVTDKTVLSFVKLLNSLYKPEKIIFLNVHSEVELPAELVEQFSNIREQVNERYIEELVAETTPLNLYGTELEFKALEGSILHAVLTVCKKEDIDLLVVGKKDGRKEHHIVHKKLIRKSPCHVLVVPEVAQPKIDKVLVATDFSEHSELATEVAQHLSKKARAQILVEHIYKVPIGYHKSGKSFTEFASIMKENAKSSYEVFHDKMNLNGNSLAHYTLDEHDNTGKTLLESAKNQKADIIVSGSRGKSNLSSVLLGSVSETLVDKDHTIPLLIVKKENETFDFWKSFYGI